MQENKPDLHKNTEIKSQINVTEHSDQYILKMKIIDTQSECFIWKSEIHKKTFNIGF